jgi:hypothetical protein
MGTLTVQVVPSKLSTMGTWAPETDVEYPTAMQSVDDGQLTPWTASGSSYGGSESWCDVIAIALAGVAMSVIASVLTVATSTARCRERRRRCACCG